MVPSKYLADYARGRFLELARRLRTNSRRKAALPCPTSLGPPDDEGRRRGFHLFGDHPEVELGEIEPPTFSVGVATPRHACEDVLVDRRGSPWNSGNVENRCSSAVWSMLPLPWRWATMGINWSRNAFGRAYGKASRTHAVRKIRTARSAPDPQHWARLLPGDKDGPPAGRGWCSTPARPRRRRARRGPQSPPRRPRAFRRRRRPARRGGARTAPTVRTAAPARPPARRARRREVIFR